MKILNARGFLADFLRANRPEEEIVKGLELRRVLLAAGFERRLIDIFSDTEGLLRRRRVIGQAELVVCDGQQYDVSELTLTVRYGRASEDEGNLVYVPVADLRSVKAQSGYVRFGDEKLAEVAGHKTVRIPMPDKVVEMPFPNWVEAVCQDGYTQASLEVSMAFESEARKAAKEFVAKLAEVGLL